MLVQSDIFPLTDVFEIHLNTNSLKYPIYLTRELCNLPVIDFSSPCFQ